MLALMASPRYVESDDGTRIAYWASGRGDPILLVHGSATTSDDWLFVLPLLREQFTVVTMDRRGRGLSGDGFSYSIEREADDILAVLDTVGAELLVGHSYGAMCAALAADRSERLSRLVLYEPPIGVPSGGLEPLEQLIARGDFERALEAFLQAVGTSREQLESIRSSPACPSLTAVVPTLPRELRSCAAWRSPTGPIEVPTLFLRGAMTKSPFYLDGFEALASAFPNARTELIPGQLHVAHVFAAEGFADLVMDFCAKDLGREI